MTSQPQSESQLNPAATEPTAPPVRGLLDHSGAPAALAPMKTPLRALLVEDSPDDADLLLIELRRSGFDVVCNRVETSEALELALAQEDWDIILSDHAMPSFNSNGVLATVERRHIDIPCIIVSGAIGEEAAVAAMRNGASDYILKDNLARLGPAVNRELREAETRKRRREAEEVVAYMVYHDPLTELPNRSLFKDRFAQAITRARRKGSRVAAMFLDIDRFKNINESLGHSVGDQLLQEIARRLRQTLREEDTISRWGGDEFILLLPDLDHVETIARTAQRILGVIRQPFHIGGQELFVTASIGIAVYPNDGEDVDTVLRNADTAMYRVKEQSRNNYQLYTRSMNARAFERLALEISLQHAIARNELMLYYQPQFDLRTGELSAMEALCRWNHPDLGLVLPNQFIPLAEESGLIIPIGMWGVREACTQAKIWQDAGLKPIRMAVNLSARQFQQPNFVQTLRETVEETGFPLEYLELEITESTAIQYVNYTSSILKDLKELGVSTAIDDFGTGYSSLGALTRFQFDRLKIDRSFVEGLTDDSDAGAIALTMIILAKSLRRRVTAEGVETYDQLEILRANGCDEVQGFLTGRPGPPEDVVRYFYRGES